MRHLLATLAVGALAAGAADAATMRYGFTATDFPIGTTQIWVGVKEEGGIADYRLGFSEVKWKSSSLPLPDEN